MQQNSFLIGIACFAIGFINVLLNISLKNAAIQENGYLGNLLSPAFASAFTVGTLSLISIFTLYYLKIDLGRGILLMGAASILGGTTISIIFFGTKLTFSEYVILGLIAMFYITKMFKLV